MRLVRINPFVVLTGESVSHLCDYCSERFTTLRQKVIAQGRFFKRNFFASLPFVFDGPPLTCAEAGRLQTPPPGGLSLRNSEHRYVTTTFFKAVAMSTNEHFSETYIYRIYLEFSCFVFLELAPQKSSNLLTWSEKSSPQT